MGQAAMKMGPERKLPTVLYIDDDTANRQAFAAAFRHDIRVLTCEDITDAWAILDRETIHVVIADQRMPGLTGSQVLHLVKERYPEVRRMLMTGYSDIQAVIDAINLGGVSHYLTKPWDHSRVVQAVERAHHEFEQDAERSDFTQRLVEANRQLEFALRQRLLS